MRETSLSNDGGIESFTAQHPRGFCSLCASKGRYSLNDLGDKASPADVVGRKSEPAVRFVLARRLMSAEDGKFRPEKILTQKEIDAAAKALAAYANYGDIGATVAAGAKELNGMTREEAATFIMERIRAALGVNIDASYPAEYFTRERLGSAQGRFRPSDFDEEYMRVTPIAVSISLRWAVFRQKICFRPLTNMRRVYINDGGITNLAGDAEYIDHQAILARMPSAGCSDDFEKIAANAILTKGRRARSLRRYSSMYANAAQLKYGAGCPSVL